MKSEPSVFGIDDLINRPKQTEPWDGVRNYQARNMLRDQMQAGDLAFFYHSNCDISGIVGTMQIVKSGYPDDQAWNFQSKYYDPKSTPDNPIWFRVDVRFAEKFPRTISLTELKQAAELSDMPLVKRGSRLSIMPVTERQWQFILSLLN